MRLLFVKHELAWPRSSGHDVHSYYLMRALRMLGHDVLLGSVVRPRPEAIAGLNLSGQFTLDPATADASHRSLTRLQERFRSYWGVERERMARLAQIVDQESPDAIVAVGLEGLPYLGGVSRAVRVWYAADEWARHHLTLVRVTKPDTWSNIYEAFVKGAYERTYAGAIDRIWVVSEPERRAMRWVAGARDVDVLANGVDSDHFSPSAVSEIPRSLIFWGRLDFGPNIDALTWFCREVWTTLRASQPDAQFSIFGFRPSRAILELAALDGVRVEGDRPDLREEISRHAVVVLPFFSGGGIKNKLLEAASMARPIVCTTRACEGLRGEPPVVEADEPASWVSEIQALWRDEPRRRRLGEIARRWAIAEHSWLTTARLAVEGLQSSLRRSSAA
jgi:glycosyltransferase involved in cell wall biosynthesis